MSSAEFTWGQIHKTDDELNQQNMFGDYLFKTTGTSPRGEIQTVRRQFALEQALVSVV